MRVYKLFTKVKFIDNDYLLYNEFQVFKDYESSCDFYQLNSLNKIGYYLGEPGFDMMACVIMDIDFDFESIIQKDI